MKSLIVEDDFSSRLLLQHFLAPYGEINFAANGLEAIEAFKMSLKEKIPYDLICLDIQMPEMDGRMALKLIRDIEESSGILYGDGVKVIMTTSLSDKDVILHAFREACDAYIIKPVEKTKLLNQLKLFSLIS